MSDDEYRVPYDMSPADIVDRLAGVVRVLHDAEALTATILNRCGVSWAAMSREVRAKPRTGAWLLAVTLCSRRAKSSLKPIGT